jgi:hypothetical protein
MTASPITPAPSPAPVTLQPIVQAATNIPVSAPPPPCTNDCGPDGAAIRNNGCACECDAEAGAVLVGGICVQKIPRRTFNPADQSCTFEPCTGLDGFMFASNNTDGRKTCVTVNFGACDAACAEAKCVAATITGDNFAPGVGDSWADPHTCVF